MASEKHVMVDLSNGAVNGANGGQHHRAASHSLADSASKARGMAAFNAASPKWYDGEPVWVAGYFLFNLALTIYNKIALNSFPYPWALTSIHCACATLGCYWLERRGYFQSTVQVGRSESLVLLAFSTLYTVNIAVSNLSLNLVSVPLHQVIRSLTPLFTILIAVLLFKKSYKTATYLSLAPVILGVALATQGDYSCTLLGFCLTMSSALLASIKGHTTNRILVGKLRFHPLELLLRMSPLAFLQCIVFSYLAGEMDKIYDATFVKGTLTQRSWLSLLANGAVAFGLNVVSFTANKKAGALSMDVAANVKQVLTIVLAVFIFDLSINATNLAGIALTIAGGMYYSYIEYKAKTSASSAAAASTSRSGSSAVPLVPATPSRMGETTARRASSPIAHLSSPRLSSAKENTSGETLHHRKASVVV